MGLFGQLASKLGPYGADHCKTQTATIADGATTSGEVDTEGYPVTGLLLDAGFNGTALAISASDVTGGTFLPIYDSDGNAIAMVVAASHAIGLTGVDAQAVSAFRYLKFVADAQTGATVITVLSKG